MRIYNYNRVFNCLNMYLIIIIKLIILIKQIESIDTNNIKLNTNINRIHRFNDTSLYLGCTNGLYSINLNQFNSNWLIASRTTGPNNESKSCIMPDIPPDGKCLTYEYCSSYKKQIDNYNYALDSIRFGDISSTNDNDYTLIECSKTFFGSCRTRSMRTLDVIGCPYSKSFYLFDNDGILSVQRNKYLYVMPSIRSVNDELYESLEGQSVKLVYFVQINKVNSTLILLQPKQQIFPDLLNLLITEVKTNQIILNAYLSFKSNKFLYLLYTLSSNQTHSQTRLMRICDDNSAALSYPLITNLKSRIAEANLTCSYNGITYTNITNAYLLETSSSKLLFAAFSQAKKTILCSTNVYQLDQQFSTSIKSCFRFEDSSASTCYYRFNTTFNNCSCSQINYDSRKPVFDDKVYDSSPNSYCDYNYGYQVYETTFDQLNYINIRDIKMNKIDNFYLTATSSAAKSNAIYKMYAHEINSNIVLTLFLDDLNVHLYKYNQRLNRLDEYSVINTKSYVVNEVAIDSINMFIDNTNTYLYSTVNNNLMRTPMNNCSQYQTCSKCLLSMNPLCGWCVYENKCGISSECSTNYMNLWVSTDDTNIDDSKCPIISEINPTILSPTQQNTVSLSVNFYIIGDREFECVLSEDSPVNSIIQVNATTYTDRVTCKLDKFGTDTILKHQDSIQFKVDLKQTNTNQVIASSKQKLIFVNCVSQRTCKSCLDTNNVNQICKWNSYESKCRFLDNNTQYSDIINSNQCAQFMHENNQTNIRLAFSSDDGGIGNFLFINFNLDITKFSFKCSFSKMMDDSTVATNSSSYDVDLKWIDTNLKKFTCLYKPTNDVELASNVFEQRVNFKITYYDNGKPPISTSDHYFIDSIEPITLDIVNCEINATSCGECLNDYLLDIKCGWCTNKNSCTTKSSCGNDDTFLSNLYDFCPSPVIRKLLPQSACGPIDGGTQITIYGVNLGHLIDDVNVYFKNNYLQSDCVEDRESYEKSVKIVCNTQPLVINSNNERNEFNLTVNVTNHVKSDFVTHKYLFIRPQIYSIEPNYTIRSGGAWITLYGKYLDCGTSKSISFNGLECDINENETNSNKITCKTSRSDEHRENIKNLEFKMDKFEQDYSNITLKYSNDPIINDYSRNKSIFSGGIKIGIIGSFFDQIQTARIQFKTPDQTYSIKNNCTIINSYTIDCVAPNLISYNSTSYTNGGIFKMSMLFNDIEFSRSASFDDYITVYDDPFFYNNQSFTDKERIFIKGEGLLKALDQSDYQVIVGKSTTCEIKSIAMSLIECVVNNISDETTASKRSLDYDLSKSELASSYDIRVLIGGNVSYVVGRLVLSSEISAISQKKTDTIQTKYVIIGACAFSVVLFVIMIALYVKFKLRQKKQAELIKFIQNEFDCLEGRVANECKEAFAELQMDIVEFSNTLTQSGGAPFNQFQTYCMKILFPNSNEHDRYCLTNIDNDPLKESVKTGLDYFYELLLNEKFLLRFIDVLEPTFVLEDRIRFASYLSICLQPHMDYFTHIQTTLLSNLIRNTLQGNRAEIRTLFRRNESVAEKMLTNWFAFLLYDYIKDCAGTPLYILFLSIKQQIYKGPVDAITCEAKYSLNQQNLLRQTIEYEEITIRVQLQDLDDTAREIHVRVLNCDTITQVKEKILDVFYKGFPYSRRPNVDDLDLSYVNEHPQLPQALSSKLNQKYQQQITGHTILYDEDRICKYENGYIRLNTLAHYKVKSGSLLLLMNKQQHNSIYNTYSVATHADTNSCIILDSLHNKNAENMTLLSKTSSKGSSSPYTYSKSSTNVLANSNDINNVSTYELSAKAKAATAITTTATTNKFHLVKPNDTNSGNSQANGKNVKTKPITKLASEVYLTRLLQTKMGIQTYVDDFFESIFSTAHGSNVLPYAIKYLYDFLDEQAQQHMITDQDVVYTWKSNSLPLRFWVNIIKNPEFVFDIHKSHIVDASLSVIAATFIDSCSKSNLDLNKESPSNKLLFFKEVHKYRQWVESYYTDIRKKKRIQNDEMRTLLIDESRKYHGVFNKYYALQKLYEDYLLKNCAKVEREFSAFNDDNNEPFKHRSSQDHHQFRYASQEQITSPNDNDTNEFNKHVLYRLQQISFLMKAIEV